MIIQKNKMMMKKILVFVLILGCLFFIGCGEDKTMYTIEIETVDGGVITTSKTSALAGSIIDITCTPNDGYEYVFNSLKFNDTKVIDNSFTMPNENVKITARFSLIDYESFNKYNLYKDLPYDDLEVYSRALYDLYVPKDKASIRGVIIYIHGGYWVQGSKEQFSDACKTTMENRYNVVAATINYHLLTESDVSADTMLDDITKVIQSIKDKLLSIGVEVNSLALIGHSAGAHLALLYSYSRSEESSIPIKFCVSLAGPSDFKDEELLAKQTVETTMLITKLVGANNFVEALEIVDKVSPVEYIKETSVPTIIAHGTKDSTVPHSNSESLDAKLTEKGVEHVFVSIKGANHGFVNYTTYMNKVYVEVSKYFDLYF